MNKKGDTETLWFVIRLVFSLLALVFLIFLGAKIWNAFT